MAAHKSPTFPFVIVTERNRPAVRPERMPRAFPALEVVDPQRLRNAEFLSRVQRLDAITFGPLGLSMPAWVFYDCGVMPGMVFGLASPASEVRPWIRRVLGVGDDDAGMVPLTLFIAIAMIPDGCWLVYTLSSLNDVAPGSTSEHLVRDTLAGGLALLPVTTLYGTVQWRSRALRHYTLLGPLEVLTAWTPAHDIPSTLTFRVPVPADATDLLLRGGPEVHGSAPAPNRVLDVDVPESLQAIQRQVEAGALIRVVAPPQSVGRYTLGLLHDSEVGP